MNKENIFFSLLWKRERVKKLSICRKSDLYLNTNDIFHNQRRYQYIQNQCTQVISINFTFLCRLSKASKSTIIKNVE